MSYIDLYYESLGLDRSDTILCEVCEQRAADIHHIDARGMGGSKMKDYIENIMALCRCCHIRYGDKKQYKSFLKSVHFVTLNLLNPSKWPIKKEGMHFVLDK